MSLVTQVFCENDFGSINHLDSWTEDADEWRDEVNCWTIDEVDCYVNATDDWTGDASGCLIGAVDNEIGRQSEVHNSFLRLSEAFCSTP